MEMAELTEPIFHERVTKDLSDPKFLPRNRDGVAARFACPFPPKKEEGQTDESFAEVMKVFEQKKIEYQQNFNAEMRKFVSGEDSAIYLVYQPIWNCQTRLLAGLEVLCRCENGKDDAPMPALANFQADSGQSETCIEFAKKQTEFAVVACKQFPSIRVSVNVRPNELKDLEKFLVAKSCETMVNSAPSNLLIEITEYAPIDDEVLKLIRAMKNQGAVFAIDDVNEVRNPTPPGMARPGHSCSFDLAKENADLFAVQKLATPLSCSVFRVGVFPTPQYAGGKAVPFLLSTIPKEDAKDDIAERKRLVESWVEEVGQKQPEVKFVIECSVYAEDLQGSPELYPQIPLFEGQFHIQGGLTGGRGFQLDAFLPC